MIQAGFLPGTHQYLYEKMGYVIQNVIKSSVEKFRIPIEESLGGYVIPGNPCSCALDKDC